LQTLAVWRRVWRIGEVAVMTGDATDAAIDMIYDAVDELLIRGEFAEVDRLLANVDPTTRPIVETLAYISISFVCAPLLPAWRPLVRRARAHFEKIAPERVDALLMGWEDEP
jgi:hypothetical protein